MTDDEADALLHPPRRWPPLSVLAASGLLVLPPTAGAILMFARGGRTELLVSLVWLAIAAGPVYRLLRGHPAGYGGAVGVWLLAALVVGGAVVAAAANGAGPATLLAALPALGWLACVAAFLYWPETRRWSGRLPPNPDED